MIYEINNINYTTMFWFFDINKKDNYYFSQIFNNNSTIIDENIIYKLTDIISDENKLIKDITPNIINFKIILIGQLISWTNLKTQEVITFLINEEFIQPKNNKFNKPIFNYKYQIVDNYRLPQLSSTSYDFNYENIEFEIYNINNNLLFINEHNKSNNSKRNYWITKNYSILQFL